MDAHARRTVVLDGLTFAYDDRVLEPRPWTLLQSSWAAELAAEVPDGPILELCAGVGHIGLVAARRSGRALVQVDANPVACDLARANAAAAGLSDRVAVRSGRLEDVVGDDERFPLVIADPPYLPTADLDAFPDDPRIAVDGGTDGLALARACLAVVDAVLVPGGRALLQLRGARQVDELTAGVPTGLVVGEVRADGPDRAVVLFSRGGHASPLDG